MMQLLLDTSVLIDVLRTRNRRREQLAELVRAGHILTTTVVNVAELYSGMRDGEEGSTEAFLSGLHCFDLTGTAARVAGELKFEWSRKGRTLALADTIVAAIAIENGCQLFTDNRRDFPMTELSLYPSRV
jgi:predicted nucleic acid-binding protein